MCIKLHWLICSVRAGKDLKDVFEMLKTRRMLFKEKYGKNM
jgi:hypothetical protein